MRSLSRWLEAWFFPADGSIEMIRERLHYENLKALTDKQLDVVRYLYMRLNIIDTKTGYLLRINTLTAGIIGILISVSARDGARSAFERFNMAEFVLLGISLVLMLLAFVFCFAIGELDYDHVTDPSDWVNQTAVRGYDHATHYENTLPDPGARKFIAKYRQIEIANILQVCTALQERRSMKEYEDLFFKITIARVRMLRVARVCVFFAWACYMLFFFLVLGFTFFGGGPELSPIQL